MIMNACFTMMLAVVALVARAHCQGLEWRSLGHYFGGGVAIAWDEGAQATLLFGDGGLQTPLGGYGSHTYEHTSRGLRLLRPKTSPPAREGARMAFDPVSKRLILFGGGIYNVDFNDTWAWDGQNWLKLSR